MSKRFDPSMTNPYTIKKSKNDIYDINKSRPLEVNNSQRLKLVTKSNSKLILTKNPQVTFFKYVYRKYTNFAVETIPLEFNGEINFDEVISCDISNNGDLVNKMVLKFILPEVSLSKGGTVDNTTETTDLSTSNTNITNFNSYIEYIFSSLRLINTDIDKENITIDNLRLTVNNYLNNINIRDKYITAKNTQSTGIQNDFDILYYIDNLDPTLTESEKKSKLKVIVKGMVKKAEFYSSDLFSDYNTKNDTLNNKNLNNYYFNWVENIGYRLIEYFEIEIGGHVIDKQYGDWILIWSELNNSIYKNDLIDKMNGNVSDLTTYNESKKDEYTIYVPLDIWFTKFYATSLPLIAMRYQNVKLNLKISKLTDCIYTNYPNDDIDAQIKLKNAFLLVDYIYLRTDERTKFAQNNLEYLIQQTKRNNFVFDSNNNNITAEIDLDHPVKYIFWTLQHETNLTNYNLFNRFDSIGVTSFDTSITNTYSLRPVVTVNEASPIKNVTLNFNGISILENIEPEYFNYVQPNICFNKSPKDGIHCYSFSLDSNKLQPSGSVNFSEIKNIRLNLEINSSFVKSGDNFILNVYGINYNILKFHRGLSKLIF